MPERTVRLPKVLLVTMLGTAMLVHLIVAQMANRDLALTIVVMRGKKVITKPFVKIGKKLKAVIRLEDPDITLAFTPVVGDDGSLVAQIDGAQGGLSERLLPTDSEVSLVSSDRIHWRALKDQGIPMPKTSETLLRVRARFIPTVA